MKNAELVKNLRKNGYRVSEFSNSEEAADYICESIQDKTVGFGDSNTILVMDLFSRLSRNNRVEDPEHPKENETFDDVAKNCYHTQIYLTSVNAMAETGELVNIDGYGNRIAGSLCEHEKVYFIVGTNKVVPTLEQAVWRARNVAAPMNAKRLMKRTPCARKGDRCYDCASPDRICNAMIIYFKKMAQTEMEIVLIDEPLGF